MLASACIEKLILVVNAAKFVAVAIYFSCFSLYKIEINALRFQRNLMFVFIYLVFLRSIRLTYILEISEL